MRHNIKQSLENLKNNMSRQEVGSTLCFDEFAGVMSQHPERIMRNIFQLFHDMVKNYIGPGVDEYPDDPESINYIHYDCTRLFVENSDNPFFADRLLANRLVSLADALKRGTQQNKIYIFLGPPGAGKSTFLNNLLKRLEDYTYLPEGRRYETVWRLDRKLLGDITGQDPQPAVEQLLRMIAPDGQMDDHRHTIHTSDDFVEIPCPSHDNPLLMIPKHMRRAFFNDLFPDGEWKDRLNNEKAYEWIFRDMPCTICSSLYNALLERLVDPGRVFAQIYAQPYSFNRRLGHGISVFMPGDRPPRERVLGNKMLQQRINRLFNDSNQIQYLFSRFAKTNDGVYALMDIKSNNTDRLMELHNIISEGIHKVEDLEENVTSLFLAIMNPEDKPNLNGYQSFTDRIEFIPVSYVMDIDTEVQIYRNTFGRHIDQAFLPGVLENFARVIISTRMNTESEAMLEWIGDPEKYHLYCDDNLQLLKMAIYRGVIPSWLTEEDRKEFTARRRRRIIGEAGKEGDKGISGRDSIKIFNEFYSGYARDDKPINMSMLCRFFAAFQKKQEDRLIPEGLLDSVLRMYDYTVLQEVKEALYYYNEAQISKDIKNYLFAVNFEMGTVEVCHYTGDRLTITEDFFRGIENRLLGDNAHPEQAARFRQATQKEYASRTLTQEMMYDNKPVTETGLYKQLLGRYTHNLKEKVLDPFMKNENFRRAIKDYDTEEFKAYDKKVRDDVTYMLNNLVTRFNYSEKGAKEVCIYVIDNDLANKYARVS
ncbi:MAG: serine protein kinase PrkA [Thermodesulfobacteriota bacterium]|nr:serine protein kinase PrkA [Thermodesulfobacteriota bacterium]